MLHHSRVDLRSLRGASSVVGSDQECDTISIGSNRHVPEKKIQKNVVITAEIYLE